MIKDNTSDNRRLSVGVKVGSITIGGGAPIVIQSMTNTDTANAESTAKQIQQLAAAGSELVRITVNTDDAAKQVSTIREKLDAVIAAERKHIVVKQMKRCRDNEANLLSGYGTHFSNWGGMR